MKSSNEIREVFLNYFEEQGHRRVKSGPLVPEDDPTLLFTNAGMNQFKQVFLGLEKRDYRRATSSQKCMRVSGKHNDLETVGRTARHHTFFEMLGNFSFSDYFKKEAIEYAWELCTQVYQLPTERLYVTVFRDDDEAMALWRDHMGVAKERIFQMDEKDNFWAMGHTGPCGPCSELHYDMQVSPAGHADCSLDCDCGRYVEIWNLVFMQFNRDQSGQITPLPSPSIDTGMGLERLTCVLQGVHSNYDTDLFRPIIEEASRITGVAYGEEEKKDISLRILADHSRACALLISDGVVPGNEGRGYVLRKILRRAIRHGKMLGTEAPFIYTLTALVSQLLKKAYPELEASRDYTAKIVGNEEEKFSDTLRQGIALLDEICEKTVKSGKQTLPGKELFRLYDTYGFPLDLAREIAEERKLAVDEEGFKTELQRQRERARDSWKGGGKTLKPVYQELSEDPQLQTVFTGYTEIQNVAGRVLAILRDDQKVSELKEGQTGEMVLHRTPFYAESGGQVADKGSIETDSARASVGGVYKPLSGLHLHSVEVTKGTLKTGDTVHSTVVVQERSNTARNHTATHLLHAALREVLGEHVKQAGSLVAANRLRFDFTHYRGVTSTELSRIEKIVNERIRDDIEVQTDIRALEDAIQEGAMALFGEKYQEQVRVVKVPGFSMELCGGTHVSRTGQIAVFKVVGESSISAGVRRVEAITGQEAFLLFLEDEAVLGQLSDQLQVQRHQLVAAIDRITQQLKEANKAIERLQLKLAHEESGDAASQSRDIGGVRVISQMVENLDRSALRQLADQLKNQLQTGVVVLGAPIDGKVSLVVMVTADLTEKISAIDLIRKIAPLVGGGGGGKADMAEAGGKDATQLGSALEQTYQFVEELLS